MKMLRLSLVVVAAMVLATGVALALGFQLGETKEQLELDYELTVTDHGTGRVTVVLTIADQGRLSPLSSVDFVIPSEDGTGFVDLARSLALREVDGKQVARVHIKKELVQRAEIQLRTSNLDRKQEKATWYYYSIPVAEHLETADPKKAAPQDSATIEDAGLPATDCG